MNTTIAFVSAGMMIPELGPAGQALNCGGLEDLNGHIAEGCVKKGISVIPITYGYPIDWRTGDPVDYYTTPARFLFNLEVSVYYESRIIPIFGVNRAGATVYLINDPEAGILYPGDVGKKIKQTAFLGMAVPALLKKIGVVPNIVWMQEWMAAATTIPTMMDDPTFATTKYVFTIHTPSRGAMDKIPLDWFDRLAINSKYRDQYIDENMIDPTLGCLRLAHGRTAVSKEHGEVSRKMFPGIPIEGIMNGTSWEYFLSNFLRKHPDPNPHQLYMAHQSDRRELIALVQELSGAALDPDLPIIGAVRRLDVYKNQLPMLQDHIAAICADRGEQVGELRGLGANVLIGGVAHENNSICKDWMRIFEEWNKNPQLKGRFIYIPSYSSSLRWKAAAGSDIWVEMPWEEWKACGTSTMVAKINGNLNIATKGGGIAEHGTEFDSETGTGDTLFIDPYGADTMFAKLTKACDWYYRFRDHGDGPWPDLRMNNYRGGEPLDVTHMIERYQERVFDSLLGKEAATTGA